MSRLDDPDYLRSDQYRDATNLNRRVNLHARFSTNPQGWFSWLASQLDYSPAARLLEVGCGPGLLWACHPECLPAAAVLSDFSPGMIGEARRTLQPGRENLHFAVLDATCLPFPTHSFDVVIANHMLYHVPNRPQALAGLRRVLKPGGRLFAATNGRGHMAELYTWVAQAANLTHAESTRLWNSVTLNFNLENGEEQLRGYFSRVEMRRFYDSLAVTEVAPLLDYTRSMMGDVQTLLNSRSIIEKLTTLWQQELDRTGVIQISKDGGLFIAD
jgi:ubiquinone/menaquinone biosynthesis C-methylase UbiE